MNQNKVYFKALLCSVFIACAVLSGCDESSNPRTKTPSLNSELPSLPESTEFSSPDKPSSSESELASGNTVLSLPSLKSPG